MAAQPTLHDRWATEHDEPVRIINRDGTQTLYHVDGTFEDLEPGDPEYRDCS